MEKKLRTLFDYNRFEQSPRLSRLIEETESRYAKALSDDDLEFVSAAGNSDAQFMIDDKKNEQLK